MKRHAFGFILLLLAQPLLKAEEVFKDDPRLQVKLTIDEEEPSLELVVDRIAKASGVHLAVPSGIEKKRRVFEFVAWQNVTAWSAMESVSTAPGVRGTWEKTPDGYRLSIPDLPPPVIVQTGPSRALFWTWVAVGLGVLLVATGRWIVVRQRVKK